MTKQVAIIGASIGGLIAAAELKQRGIGVTLIERGNKVGGMYGKVQTPFGAQELGMHVLYLAEPHFHHLQNMVGHDRLQVWRGYRVDIGGAFDRGELRFNSIYPDVRNTAVRESILNQLVTAAQQQPETIPNAEVAARARFGSLAAQQYVFPILEKLWNIPADQLSAGALHCFFDLRRIVACDKQQADELKKSPAVDNVLANPEQRLPAGDVFGGRLAVRFDHRCHDDLSEVVLQWLKQQGINIHLNTAIAIENTKMIVGGSALASQYDACIIASPLMGLIPDLREHLTLREMTIYYFQLARSLGDLFPAYYVLCHDAGLLSARIVNYAAYQASTGDDLGCVIAVEVLHRPSDAPPENVIAQELYNLFPSISILASYQLPGSLVIPAPSVANGQVLDRYTDQLQNNNADIPLYFSGMRTDQGVFFSHHTIGHAYDSALECAARLS